MTAVTQAFEETRVPTGRAVTHDFLNMDQVAQNATVAAKRMPAPAPASGLR